MNNKTSRFFMAVPACIMIALLLSGCAVASDYLMQALMLVKSPDKLVYVAGKEEEIILSGGRMIERNYTSNNSHLLIRLEVYADAKYLHENVDFSKEGTYLIAIAKKRWFSWKYYFQYIVQVVPQGEYNVSETVPEDDFFFEKLSPTYCENVTAIMTAPPANIIYPVGYTGEIDPSGIVVKPTKGWFPKKYDINDLDYTLESDVDFNTPGSYIVKVTYMDEKGKEYWFCFTVAVAERAG